MPLPRVKKKKEGKRKKKGLCTVPHIFAYLKQSKTQKSSSPQVNKHNLTSKFGGSMGGKGDPAFTSSTALVY